MVQPPSAQSGLRDGDRLTLATADVYPARGVPGATEEIVDRWLKDKRDRFVLAGKCGGQFGADPEYAGCSRRHILRSVEDSLRRLGTDRLDLYQLHRFDPDAIIDETLAALDSLVRSGKVSIGPLRNANRDSCALPRLLELGRGPTRRRARPQ